VAPHQPTAVRAAADFREEEVPWAAVNRMLDEMDLASVLAHQLGPLAAIRWSETGRPVPEQLAVHQRGAQVRSLQAAPILARARDAYPGRLMILKGPELDRLYPQGGRFYGDLDLLADDADAARAALLAAGFEPIAAALDGRPHHLPPLWWPGSHLPIELHTQLNWPRHLNAPPNDELFDAAVPSSLPVPGLEAPAPAHHAALMAAHGWKHMPLRSIRDLIDVTVLAHLADPDEVEHVARRWGLAGVWRTTTATSRWLFEGGRAPTATRLWARNLRGVREPSILERHVRRWITPFWMLPLPRALVASSKNVFLDMRPVDDEPWGQKLRRVAFVAAHPRMKRSDRARPPAEDDF
jgi:hypothetical protein